MYKKFLNKIQNVIKTQRNIIAAQKSDPKSSECRKNNF